MKVLHFFKTYWPDTFGGIERTIHAIAKGTEKYGVSSQVLSLSKTPEANTVLFDGHMAFKSKLDCEFASTGFSRSVFRRFDELSSEADVVHFHFPWPLMDAVRLLSHSKKPSVLTYHSDVVKQKVLLQLYKPLMYGFLNSMDRVVTTSPNYLASSEVLRGLRTDISVIPIGLDQSDYPPSDDETLAAWRGRFPGDYFLFIGVLRYYKGIHTLLSAAKLTQLDVVIVGSGPLEMELKSRARAENMTNVHFVGSVSDVDKVALLQLCTAVVFPSHLRSEAFGLSLVEASMFGKPMISCEIGTGTSFVNLDEQTGYVIEPQNSQELADRMMSLVLDKSKRTLFGLAARKRFLQYFTAEGMAKSYFGTYQGLCGANHKNN